MSRLSSSAARSDLNDAQREEIVRLYESGVLNGAQLARRYGVHRDKVYRHLKASGAVKARLIHETTHRVEAEIDARQRRKRQALWEDEDRRLDAFIKSGEAVQRLMEALLQADRDGELAEFGRALGAM